MPSLSVRPPDRTPVVYRLCKPIASIGRARVNDVTLADPLATEIHLQIVLDKGQYYAVAVDHHGLLEVNGKVCKQHRLGDHDRIRIGSTEIVFYLQDPTGPTACVPLTPTEMHREILRFSRQIFERRAPDQLLTALLDSALRIASADKGFLILLTGPEPRIAAARNGVGETFADARQELSDTIIQHVIDSRAPLALDDLARSPRARRSRSAKRLRLRAVLCVPLLEQSGLLGVLYIGQHGHGPPLTPALDPVLILATQAALLLSNAHLRSELHPQEETPDTPPPETRRGHLLGGCPAMQAIFAQLPRIALTDSPILIQGEPGTGKRLLAREIHDHSAQRGPFKSLPCGALSEDLLQRHLFGTAPDPPPSAPPAPPLGTLHLGDIHEMPPPLQHQTVRWLSEHPPTTQSPGIHRPGLCRPRLIVSTCMDLEHEVTQGRLLPELLGRLDATRLSLPPLRERGEDLFLLAKHLLDHHAQAHRSPARGLSPSAVALMRRYPWPGNITELDLRIRRAVLQAVGSFLGPADLRFDEKDLLPIRPLDQARERFCQNYIREVLELCGGRRTEAARRLGINRSTLYRYLGGETTWDDTA
ncbi:MAG TPA: sigma 54-interacting transcriptional regulator [Polyangia bacterium]|nr:sigma 54-interacting transcriptional regulator [Polyangia bacterium]